MGTPKSPGTLPDDFMGSESDGADPLDGASHKEASGSSDLLQKLKGWVLDSESVVVGDAGGIFCNVEASTQSFDGLDSVEREKFGHVGEYLHGNGAADGIFCNVEALNHNFEVLKSMEGEKLGHGVDSLVGNGKFFDVDASLLKVADTAKQSDASGDGISPFVQYSGVQTKLLQDDEVDICSGLQMSVNKGGNAGEIEEELAFDNQNHNFSVGDVVWFKTKVDSWWPGIICDPIDVPNYSAKCPQRGCLLVGYYGNGNFAWCSPSHLRPFSENFEVMSKQGNSRNFKVAIAKAVDDTGKHVKLKMTCVSRMKGNQYAVDAGSVAAASPETGNSVIPFEPAGFLAQLKLLSCVVYMPTNLELAIIRSHLSAFYSSLSHCELSTGALQGTPCAENNAQNNLLQGSNDGLLNHMNCQIPRKTNGSFLHMSLADGVLKLKGNENLSTSSAEGDVAEEVTSASGIITKSHSGEVIKNYNHGNRKRTGSIAKTASKFSIVENGDACGFEVKNERAFESRERKKSKYLSPPYVNLKFGRSNPPASGDNEELLMKPNAQQSGESLSFTKRCCKQKKKLSTKANPISLELEDGISSAELLSGARFAAVHCYYSGENLQFDLFLRFFSSFRSSEFRCSYNCEMCSNHINHSTEALAPELPKSRHSLPAVKSVRRKIKRKAMAILANLNENYLFGRTGQDGKLPNAEHLSNKLTAAISGQDGSFGLSGSLEKNPKGLLQNPLSKHKSHQKTIKKDGQKNLVGQDGSLGSSCLMEKSQTGLLQKPLSQHKSHQKMRKESDRTNLSGQDGSLGSSCSLEKSQNGLLQFFLSKHKSHQNMRKRSDKKNWVGLHGSLGSSCSLEKSQKDLLQNFLSKHKSHQGMENKSDTNNLVGQDGSLGSSCSLEKSQEGLLQKHVSNYKSHQEMKKKSDQKNLVGQDGSSGSSCSLEKSQEGLLKKPLSIHKSLQKVRKKSNQKNLVGQDGSLGSSCLSERSQKAKSYRKKRKKRELRSLAGSRSVANTDLSETTFSVLIMKPEETNRKEGSATNQVQVNEMGGIPDLNGNAEISGLVAEDTAFIGSVAPECNLVPEMNPTMGDLPVEQNMSSDANDIRVQDAATSSCLGTNSMAATADINGSGTKAVSLSIVDKISAKPCSFKNDSPVAKKRRRAKPKLTFRQPLAGIPDLNGDGDADGSSGPEMINMPKKRKRESKPDLSINFSPVGTDGEISGTALLLAFAPEFPVPPLKALVGTFNKFGPLIESEIRVVEGSNGAQVVFSRSSDAGDAFRSLEKNKPFGTALVNYRLHNNLSEASRAVKSDRNLQVHLPSRTAGGLVIRETPLIRSPLPGEASPSLVHVRQNLEIMTSMLEKSGKDLSLEMRMRLESEIKNLLKKVTTIAGSSPS